MLGLVLPLDGAVVVRGWLEVVVPELIPPMFVVGAVLPMGGVVPGAVLGAVPVVVLGLVPVVVFGAVPGIVEGVVLVGATELLALGGQTVLLPAGLGEDAGIVALGLVDDGLVVLAIGELDVLGAGEVEVTGQVADGVDLVVRVVAGLVLWIPVLAPAELVD